MEPKLPELFGLLPKAPVTVEPIPDFAKAESTHYVAGTPDGKRPGRVVVAVADPTKRTLITDESVAYHEGVPGHHMQISIAQTLPDLPSFVFTAFTPPMRKVGRFMPRSWGRRSVSIKSQCQTTAG